MTEINLLDDLNPMCPRGCGRTMDDCYELEDGSDCAGGELWRENQRLKAKLEQLRAELERAKPVLDAAEPCESTHKAAPDLPGYYRCEFPAGHKSDHGALRNTVVWFDDVPAEGLSSTDTTAKGEINV